MKRALCVYFPHWPLQRLLHDRPTLRNQAVAILQPPQTRGAKVRFCSREAWEAGIRLGMPVAEANAVAPQIHFEEEDARRDRDVLTRLAVWAERFSPFVGLEDMPEPECLLLDVTGCERCFQGEDNLLRRVRCEFWDEGWWVRPAIADTIGAAWALAHALEEPVVAPARETEKHLAALPVSSLRLGEETLTLLDHLGLRTIGQVLALPRRDLALRFDAELLRRLDQALGCTPEIVQPHPLQPEIEASLDLDYPIDHLPSLKVVLERLAGELEDMLRRRHVGARQVECRLHYPSPSGGADRRGEAGLVPASPSRDPCLLKIGLFRPTQSAAHLCKMLLGQLEKTRLEEPVCAVSLKVPRAETIAESQGDFLAPAPDWQALGRVLDQLSHTLGPDEVLRASLVADYQPEYACRFESVAGGKTRSNHRGTEAQRRRRKESNPGRDYNGGFWNLPGQRKPLPEGRGTEVAPWSRPVKLWPTPVPLQILGKLTSGAPARFRWRGKDFEVLHAWGPERIETGWWRGQYVRRDYFTLVTHAGNRFWVFRQAEDRWYLHGSFD